MSSGFLSIFIFPKIPSTDQRQAMCSEADNACQTVFKIVSKRTHAAHIV